MVDAGGAPSGERAAEGTVVRTFAAAAVSLALLLPDWNRAAEAAAPPATAASEPAPAAAPAPRDAGAATAPARVPDLTIKAPPDLDFILLDERLSEPPADKALGDWCFLVVRDRRF
jgi:hypothetical protein